MKNYGYYVPNTEVTEMFVACEQLPHYRYYYWELYTWLAMNIKREALMSGQILSLYIKSLLDLVDTSSRYVNSNKKFFGNGYQEYF